MHETDDLAGLVVGRRSDTMPTGASRPWTQCAVRVGSDMVDVGDVAESIRQFGRQYIERVFTPLEAETCTGPNGPSAERLAARFAAKESVVKALRPTTGVHFHDIEIWLDEDGAPEVALHGSVLAHARSIGVVDSSLSLTHDHDRASAVFLAVLDAPASDDDHPALPAVPFAHSLTESPSPSPTPTPTTEHR